MAQSLDALIKQGEADQDAVDVGDGIFMSKNIANSYLVTTAEGDVLINTGTDFEAAAIKARFARVSKGPLRVITFTQGHPDHVGGWDLFNAARVETIAQANHRDVREYWRRLHPFYSRRIMALWGAFMDVEAMAMKLPPEPVLTTAFIDSHTFEVGGSSSTRHRAARPPTRWWSGCPSTAPSSSVTCWGRFSATFRICTPCGATRFVAPWRSSARSTESSR